MWLLRSLRLQGSLPAFFGWWRDGTPDARRALIAAALGWMLDAFDVMLYALLLTSIIADLGISRQTAGAIGSVTLLAAAAGGLLFGVVADRYGRTRALMASVAIYSVFTAACGLATSALQLAMFRILLGIGMGGEWASGAALVSETWPTEHRGKALGLMQSAWAIGYGLAAAVTMVVLPRWGWRVVFFVGVLPAFLTFWVRRNVREPELWLRSRGSTRARGRLGDVFRDGRAGVTAAVTAMNACTLFAWWGFNLWLPGFLSSPPASGGIGLSATGMSWFIIAMQVGMWFGYITFGYISDAVGRKRTYVAYLVSAAVLIAIYTSLRDAAGTAAARAVRRVLRDRLLQRLWCRDGGDLSHRHPRDCSGLHLQPGPHRERRRAVHRRYACSVTRLRRRALDDLGGVRAGGGAVDLDSGDERAQAGLRGNGGRRRRSKRKGNGVNPEATDSTRRHEDERRRTEDRSRRAKRGW